MVFPMRVKKPPTCDAIHKESERQNENQPLHSITLRIAKKFQPHDASKKRTSSNQTHPIIALTSLEKWQTGRTRDPRDRSMISPRSRATPGTGNIYGQSSAVTAEANQPHPKKFGYIDLMSGSANLPGEATTDLYESSSTTSSAYFIVPGDKDVTTSDSMGPRPKPANPAGDAGPGLYEYEGTLTNPAPQYFVVSNQHSSNSTTYGTSRPGYAP